MTELIWKEWYELRKLPWIAAVSIVSVAVMAHVLGSHNGLTSDSSMSESLLVPLWGLTALVAGAGLFSQEIGSEGLVFLSILPISRARIWWIKLVVGFCALSLSVAASAVAWTVSAFLLDGQAVFFSRDMSGLAEPSGVVTIGMVILFSTCAYLVAVFVSPAFDRLMPALCGAGAVCILGATAFQAVAALISTPYGLVLHNMSESGFSVLIASIAVPVLMTVSYATFTRGESLRTSKRLIVGAKALAASLSAAAVFFLAGFQLRWW